MPDDLHAHLSQFLGNAVANEIGAIHLKLFPGELHRVKKGLAHAYCGRRLIGASLLGCHITRLYSQRGELQGITHDCH